MLMLKCKTCGEALGYTFLFFLEPVIQGTSTNADTSHTCSRKHTNEYVTIDYMDWL